MNVGLSYNVSVTMKNTGNASWNSSNLVGLAGFGNSSLFGPVRIMVPSGVTVLPDQSYAFNFTLKAPSTTGTYILSYQMIYNNTKFGQVLNKTVPVYKTVYNSSLVVDDISGIMIAGDQNIINIAVHNSGNVSWSGLNGIVLDGLANSSKFSSLPISLLAGKVISPGSNYTFTFTVTAPLVPGVYNLSYIMASPSGTFGQMIHQSVDVVEVVDDAQMVSSTLPATVDAGKTYDVLLTVKNNGSTSWTGGSMLKLDGVWNESKYGPAVVSVPEGVTIAPGHTYTFQVHVNAPNMVTE
jgi:hypothetical protein